MEKYLDEKLICLRVVINSLSEMTHLHECFTLLRSCAAACKVTHLMLTTPPKQLKKFIEGFDFLMRKGMEKIIVLDLNEQYWLICQLAGKYGGF